MPIQMSPIQRGTPESEREQILDQMERMRLAMQELQYGDATHRGVFSDPQADERPELQVFQAGQDGFSYEHIYTQVAQQSDLTVDKYPLNRWGFRRPGTIGGQQWVADFPGTDDDNPVVIISQRRVQGAPSPGTAVSSSWDTPRVYTEKGPPGDPGTDGRDGIDAPYNEEIFARYTSPTLPPAKYPDNAWGYDNPGTADGLVWTDGERGATATEQYEFVAKRPTSGRPMTGDAVTDDWMSPTIRNRWPSDGGQGIQGIPGTDGADGYGTEYLHAVTADSVTEIPAGQLPSNSWGFKSPGTIGGLEWHVAAPNTSETHQKLWQVQRDSPGSPNVGDAISDDFTTPAVVSRWGNDGRDGRDGSHGQAFEPLYTVSSTRTLETSKYPDNSWTYLSGGTADGQVWVTSPPDTSETYPYELYTQRRIDGSIQSGDVVTATFTVPTVLSHYGRDGLPGDDGRDGSDGTGFTFRGEWDTSVAYEENDIVRYEGSDYISILRSTGVTPYALLAEDQRSSLSPRPGGAITGTGTALDPYVFSPAAHSGTNIGSRLIGGQGTGTLTTWVINQVTEIGEWRFVFGTGAANVNFSIVLSVYGPGVDIRSGTALQTARESGATPLTVRIDATVRDSTIKIEIQDDGPGDPRSAFLTVTPPPYDYWNLYVSKGDQGLPGIYPEYIFTRVANIPLATSKYPDNSWGYDQPGTVDGQTWTDEFVSLTAELPYGLRAEREVAAGIAVGTPVDDQWKAPVVTNFHGATFRVPGNFDLGLNISEWNDTTIEQALPLGEAVDGDRVTVLGTLTAFNNAALYHQFDMPVGIADVDTPPSEDDYAFQYRDGDGNLQIWSSSATFTTLNWSQIEVLYFRLTDMTNWITHSGVTSTNLIHFAFATDRNNWAVFKFSAFDQTTDSRTSENVIRIRCTHVASLGLWNSRMANLYWMSASFAERELQINPFAQYRETRTYNADDDEWISTNLTVDGDLIVEGSIRGRSISTEEPVIVDNRQVGNAVISRRNLQTELFHAVNAIGKDIILIDKTVSHKASATSTTYADLGTVSATKTIKDTNIQVNLKADVFRFSSNFWERERIRGCTQTNPFSGGCIIYHYRDWARWWRGFTRITPTFEFQLYINNSDSFTGATQLALMTATAVSNDDPEWPGEFTQRTIREYIRSQGHRTIPVDEPVSYDENRILDSTVSITDSQWPVGEERFILLRARLTSLVRRDQDVPTSVPTFHPLHNRLDRRWPWHTRRRWRENAVMRDITARDLSSYSKRFPVEGLGNDNELTVSGAESAIVFQLNVNGLGFGE